MSKIRYVVAREPAQARNSSAEANVSTSNPLAVSKRSIAFRTARSSSMTVTFRRVAIGSLRLVRRTLGVLTGSVPSRVFPSARRAILALGAVPPGRSHPRGGPVGDRMPSALRRRLIGDPGRGGPADRAFQRGWERSRYLSLQQGRGPGD